MVDNHPRDVFTVLPIDAVITKDGRPITTSLKVAEIFGKQHKNVLRDIHYIDCSEEFGRLNFEPSSYINEQSKQQPMYEITKDGFIFLVMGFTGAQAARFKEAYIARFNAMEAQLKTPVATPNILISCIDPTQVATYTHLSTAILNLTAAVERLTAQLPQIAQTQPAPQQLVSKPQEPTPPLQFLNAWWDCLSARDVTASDLCRIIEGQQCPVLTQAAADLFGPGTTLTGRRIGATLRTWSQQTLEGFSVLNKGKAKNSVLWRLERTQ